MSKMIFVCRQTAIQGHELNTEYSCLNYCEECINKEDCDATPYWINDSSITTKTEKEGT